MEAGWCRWRVIGADDELAGLLDEFLGVVARGNDENGWGKR